MHIYNSPESCMLTLTAKKADNVSIQDSGKSETLILYKTHVR